MRKLITIILLLVSFSGTAQTPFDHRGQIRMLYGTSSMDTLNIEFDSDTVKIESPTNPFYEYYGGVMMDSIRVNGGNWLSELAASQWTTSGSNIYYNDGNVGINNATPSYKLDVGGLIGGSNIETNTTSLSTKLGYEAGLNENETAARYNVFIGYNSGYSNTTGNYNTFNGYQTGYSNTTGNYNTFNGYYAGYSNTTGYSNTFNGYQAGTSNTTGIYNTFNGYQAGTSNTTGIYNTFNGYQAGYMNTTGHSNTFNGSRAGYSNTTGHSNTFNGYQAGISNTTGHSNTFNGYQAGTSNTTGISNTFNGAWAGYSNTTGSSNIIIGYNAGYYGKTYSDRLIIDNQKRGTNYLDSAHVESKAIIYGYMDADPAYQRLTINGNVRVNGYIYRRRYGASAYIPDDATCTTAASTTWKFVGAGANNKFVNINANGFTTDGDTLQFNQRAGDLRDSVSFTLGWSTTSKATNNGVIVTYGIFTKRVGEANYTERQWLSMTNKMQTSGDYYSWSCSPMLIFLTDDEKIQIRVKTASTSTTITTEDFATTIREN